MDILSLEKYLDVSDTEKNEKKKHISSSSDSSSDYSRKRKRMSRSRDRHKRKDKYKKHRHRRRSSSSHRRKSKHRRRDYRSRSKSSSSSNNSSSISKPSSHDSIKEFTSKSKSRENKWSTAEDVPIDNKKIVTIKNIKDREELKLPKNKIDNIQHNEKIEIEQKEKPNFEPSGLLAKQTNTFKYNKIYL